MRRPQLVSAAALGAIAVTATLCLPGAYRDPYGSSTSYAGYPLAGLDADAVIAAAQQVLPDAETRQSASFREDTIIDSNASTDPLLAGTIRVSRGEDDTVTDVTCSVTSEHGELSPIIAFCIELPVEGADIENLRATMSQLFVTAPSGSTTSVRYPGASWYFSVDQYRPVVKDYWVSVAGRST